MSKAQTDLTPLARLQAKWRATRMPTLAAAADALQPHIEAAKVRQQVHEELLAKNVALREENERLNGLYWRDRNVATLTARVTALEQALDSLVSAVVRDDNPRDQGHFSGSDEMLYALSVLVATPAQPKCIDHPNPIIREMARFAEGK